MHTSDFIYKGYTHHTSAEDPQYEIKSLKTNQIAAYKATALTKVDSWKAEYLLLEKQYYSFIMSIKVSAICSAFGLLK